MQYVRKTGYRCGSLFLFILFLFRVVLTFYQHSFVNRNEKMPPAVLLQNHFAHKFAANIAKHHEGEGDDAPDGGGFAAPRSHAAFEQ